MADNYFERMAAYRKWREEGHGEKIIYSPSAYPREDIKKKEDVKLKYDKLEHPAIGDKKPKTKTLEEEKEEWDFCMDEADHQTMVRREMVKIRKEWKDKGWKEESITDTHKVIHEAEKRVKLMPKKDINKHKPGAHSI